MRFEITAILNFTAGHQLRLYDNSLEPLHSHDWAVRLTVGSGEVDSIGMVMDFHELERIAQRIITPLNRSSLNEAPEFASLNPSAENIALHIGISLTLPNTVKLLSVEVWETAGNSAIYRP